MGRHRDLTGRPHPFPTRRASDLITWSLARQPDRLDRVLERRPRAIFLSFGDLAPFATKVVAAGVPLIAQVQTVASARAAIGHGAAIIVAQGTEAGGQIGRAHV